MPTIIRPWGHTVAQPPHKTNTPKGFVNIAFDQFFNQLLLCRCDMVVLPQVKYL